MPKDILLIDALVEFIHTHEEWTVHGTNPDGTLIMYSSLTGGTYNVKPEIDAVIEILGYY